MIDDTLPRDYIAAILAAGILAGVGKSSTASRAVSIFNDILAALAATDGAPEIERRDASPTARPEPRVTWVNKTE